MLEKRDILCISMLKRGPFFHTYIIGVRGNNDRMQKYQLRAMSKQAIVQDRTDEEMVMNELYIRSNIRHPFLVNQVFAFQDYDTLFYATEYAPMQLLGSQLLPKRLRMDVVRFYAAEIFSALHYLHSKNQVYTFLSPDNILLGHDGHIKLDYDFCNGLNESNDYVLRRIEYASLSYLLSGNFTRCNDYWSYGIVLYRLATGYTPYGASAYEETIDQMMKRDLEFPHYVTDTDFMDLVSLLIGKGLPTPFGSKDEDAEIVMGHPFFHGINWDDLAKKKVSPPFVPVVHHVSPNMMVSLNMLYASDFIVGNRDGYGPTFSNYNSVSFLKN